MAPRKNKNVPATRQNTTPANVVDQMALDAQTSSGFENVGADDIAIPFIVILQALSPQVRGQSRIKGAKEGDFFNTVTNDILGETIQIVPCAYEKAYVEWVLRENGGGFINKHTNPNILTKTKRNDKGQDILSNGNQIVTTAYHYCLLLGDSEPQQIVIGLTSTQLKKSRRWNSTMLGLKIKVKRKYVTPPMFSHIYTVDTLEESNELGTWTGWNFSNPELIQDPELYMSAKKLHDDVTKGVVRMAPPPNMAEHSGIDNAEVIDNDDGDVF